MAVDLKRVSRDTLYIAVFTTMTILIWVGLAVVGALKKSPVAKVLKQQLEPLPAGLNQEMITKLKQRKQIEETEIQALPVTGSVTESGKRVSMEVTPPPVSTASGKSL